MRNRHGRWPPVAKDGGYDHHFEEGDRFSILVQLQYLFKEFAINATVELLPKNKSLYSEGVLRVVGAGGGIMYERELPPTPGHGPTEAHAEILTHALTVVGIEAEVVLRPDTDFSVESDDAAD